MRFAFLLLTVTLSLPLLAHGGDGEPVMWMRALRLETISTEAKPDDGLRATLISAEPQFRPCAEFLPAAPPAVQAPVSVGVSLWEEGGVRSVRVLSEITAPFDRAARCLTEALQGLDFPDDPVLSDDRRLELSFVAHWTAARLDLVAVTEADRARADVEDPTVEGRVDLVSISARINSIQPRLARCMRAARKRNPELGHRVAVRLRLAQNREDPQAPEAWLEALSIVESDLGDEEAEVCLVRELERLSWPRPLTRVAAVTWPFLFQE